MRSLKPSGAIILMLKQMAKKGKQPKQGLQTAHSRWFALFKSLLLPPRRMLCKQCSLSHLFCHSFILSVCL